MTKEEFNKKWPMSGIPDSIRKVAVAWGDAYNWFIEDKVKLAQDILEATDKHIQKTTQKQAVAFAEWINGEMYECFLHTDENVKFWHDVNGNGNYTTEELYTLFLQSQSK